METTLLYDLVHKEAKVYVDDMIIKSKQRDGHVLTLWKFFTRLIRYNKHLKFTLESLLENCKDTLLASEELRPTL